MNIEPYAIYNLHQEFEHIRDSFEKAAGSEQVKFHLPDNLPVAYWDMRSLSTHVFKNIFFTAKHHMPVGATLSVSAKLVDIYSINIEISYPTLKHSIASKNASHDNHKSDDDGRASLMISNVRKCVQAHGGAVGVTDSPENLIITFEIALPLYRLCIQ